MRRFLDTKGPAFDHGRLTWTGSRSVAPAPKAARVPTSIRNPWSRRLARLLAAAVLIALILGQGGRAGAAAVSSGSDFDGHEHSLYCGCGVKCKQASCCCGPSDEKPRSARPTAADAGPCMSSAPCGVPMPPRSTAGFDAKNPALLSHAREPRVEAGRLLPSLARCILPPRRSSRLDDPPDRPDVA